MGLTADTIARLKALVPDLGNRVEGAASLAALAKAGGAPQAALVAHVVPTGIGGGKPFPLMGMYRQATERLVSVLLTVNTGHAQGGHWADRIEALIDDILLAMLGWQPTGSAGVFNLRRAQLVDATGGVFRYEITFSCEFEVRVTTP
jgi:hypothetical protein